MSSAYNYFHFDCIVSMQLEMKSFLLLAHLNYSIFIMSSLSSNLFLLVDFFSAFVRQPAILLIYFSIISMSCFVFFFYYFIYIFNSLFIFQLYHISLCVLYDAYKSCNLPPIACVSESIRKVVNLFLLQITQRSHIKCGSILHCMCVSVSICTHTQLSFCIYRFNF